MADTFSLKIDMNQLPGLDLATIPYLFEEVQFRFFKRFKARQASANQYGFFDEQCVVITIDEVATSVVNYEILYLYRYYAKTIVCYEREGAVSVLKQLHQEQSGQPDADVVFVFPPSFDQLIALTDDELMGRLYSKKRP
jgi:hypothetical protein